jgi:uridine phosphorylase
MRNLYTFDAGPKSYHLQLEKAHPNVLTGGSPDRIFEVGEYLDWFDEPICNRGLVTINGEYKGMPVTAFSTGMGPSSVSITLPEVIEACEENNMNIIRIGTSGGLQKYLNIGDFAITTKVDRDESTSDKIMGKDYVARSSPKIRNMLKHVVNEEKKDFQKAYVGVTRVTDDIYFDALASKYKDHGKTLAVSMEFSVICALRDRYNKDDHRKIQAGNLLVISDNIVTDHNAMDMTEFKRKQKVIEEVHIRSGLETLLRLRE